MKNIKFLLVTNFLRLSIAAVILSNCFISIAQENGLAIFEINKGWQFRQESKDQWYPASIPGCVHTDLLANKLIEDPFYRTNEKSLQWIEKENWEYQTTFDVPGDFLKMKNIDIYFKGLDTYAEVILNGKNIIIADNMFREWRADCKSLLKKKQNKLYIKFTSPVNTDALKEQKNGYPMPNGPSAFSRKAPYHYGWDWGPRFVTSGVWRPVYIEAWDNARLTDVYIVQKEISTMKVDLSAHVSINALSKQKLFIKLLLNGKECARKEMETKSGINLSDIDFKIENPRLWWPNGLGEAYLYSITVQIGTENEILDQKLLKTGIRKIEVVQQPDAEGKGSGFCFKVNDVAVFAKGANYIPSDAFLNRVTNEEYEMEIKSAADANMNMLRVWGGGTYENDIFYDLCDRYGILVWQEFMFACNMYPGDSAFLENVKQEAVENVKRLRNHPSIALWCGNNENEVGWGGEGENQGWGWKKKYTPEQRIEVWGNYIKLFDKLLRGVVNENTYDGFYWRSSPSTKTGEVATYGTHSGDMHFWGVWHGKLPFSDFNKYVGRFVSEYGFQSFPELKTVKTFTVPADWNIESEVMSLHQKSGIGNLLIKDYMQKDYRDPKDFPSFLYLSQVLQAEGIRMAIEAHRRNMPYCMGSLYWQLNDCWPVASWASTDYYRRWKAVHYFAKKAYAETVVMPYLDKDSIKVYVATDRQKPFDVTLQLLLMDFDGKVLWEKSVTTSLQANIGLLPYKASVAEIIGREDKKNVFLVSKIKENDNIVAENTLYLLPVKDLDLPKTSIAKLVNKTTKGYEVILYSDKLAKNICLSLENTDGFFSDNYFDLLPGKRVVIELQTSTPIKDIEKEISVMSLIDSF
jgi:beta-mannosidase